MTAGELGEGSIHSHVSIPSFILALRQGDDIFHIPPGQQKLLSASVHLHYETCLSIDSFQDRLAPLPEGWRRQVHPEGNVFFYHEGLVCFFFMCSTYLLWTLCKRIFTESNVIHHEKEILFYATTLIQEAIDLNTDGVIMDELTEIVLNVDGDRFGYYYFVDHKNRLLFWVHQVDLREDLGMHLQGITEYDHISTFDTPLLSFTDTFRIFGRGTVLVCFF